MRGVLVPHMKERKQGKQAGEEDEVNCRQAESHELSFIHSLEEARPLETPPENEDTIVTE